jgi:hypothetical protein
MTEYGGSNENFFDGIYPYSRTTILRDGTIT